MLDFHYNQQFNYNIRTVAGIYAAAEKTAVHIKCVKILHGCCASKHLH